jgi:hypothetical protein
MPNMPSFPPLQAPAGMGQPAGDRPAALGDDEGEEDEATRVHAPAPEVLQTLALHQAVAAKNAAAMSRVNAARPAAGMPPPSPESSEELAAAARDAAMPPPHGDLHGGGGRPAPTTPVPPSGATLMMSPAAHAAAQHAVAAAQAAAAAAAAQGGAPQGAPPAGGYAPGAPPYGMNSTLAMMPPTPTPGLGFQPPAPAYGTPGSNMHGSGMSGNAPGADPMFGSAPPSDPPFGSSAMQPEALFGSLSSPPVQATEPLNLGNMQGLQRMSNNAGAQGQQQNPSMQPPYGQGSAMVAPMGGYPAHGAHGGHQGQPGPHGNAAFGPSSFAPQPGVAPKSGGIPVLPIAIALGVLALAGGVLGIFAMRARGGHGSTTDPSAMSASADPASLTPVPVPVPVPEATAVPSVMAEVDAAPAAAAEPEPAPTAPPAETATAAPTAAPTAAATAAPATATATATAVTATAVPVTPPPTTATAAASVPKPVADPNAFNEAAAKTRLAQANGVLVICQKGSGVSGPGHASVTFANDGSVSAVAMDPPYAGTKEGDCAAAQFRRAKVSAFTGAPQTIRHSFEVPK